MRRALLVAVAAAAAVVLTACTGVPTSSTPEVIRNVGVGSATTTSTPTPTPNADQHEIVTEFLAAADVSDDTHHTAARNFLTPQARNRWTDATTTVVNTWQIGNFSPSDSTVSVRAQVLGSVSAVGIYTPVLQGDGNGGPTMTFSFKLTKDAAGQWRIDSLPSGVLIQSGDFDTYKQVNLYFYNLAGTQLVADPRYVALDDPSLLANWLIQQLIAGSRPELQTVTQTPSEALQPDPKRVVVTSSASTTSINIPGARQLDPETRNYLAAQVAATLQQVKALPQSLMITDGTQPVTIQAANGTTFTASSFDDGTAPAAGPAPVFYLRGGAVIDQRGDPLEGSLGTTRYHLTSVAVARNGETDLYIAGVSGPASDAHLLMGTRTLGLKQTTIRGQLSRPTWAPDGSELWIGAGNSVWRVPRVGAPRKVTLTPTSGVSAGRVVALRISPDGSRLAVVLKPTGGTGQLWVGSILRGAGNTVSVVSLEQISPQGVDVSDVAWYGPLTLFAIGSDGSPGDVFPYDTRIDGSLWQQRSNQGLPQAADSITVAENAPAWVSAGTTVWYQPANGWDNPLGNNDGTDPAYLE